MRKVLIEKYKKYDYVDNFGNYVWLNKYGDIIMAEDRFGNSNVLMGRKGNTYVEAGYVYVPYIPIASPNRGIVVGDLINASSIINRYANRIASANYIVCAPSVADVLRIATNVGLSI